MQGVSLITLHPWKAVLLAAEQACDIRVKDTDIVFRKYSETEACLLAKALGFPNGKVSSCMPHTLYMNNQFTVVIEVGEAS